MLTRQDALIGEKAPFFQAETTRQITSRGHPGQVGGLLLPPATSRGVHAEFMTFASMQPDSETQLQAARPVHRQHL